MLLPLQIRNNISLNGDIDTFSLMEEFVTLQKCKYIRLMPTATICELCNAFCQISFNMHSN